jgi:hypothetical protein
MGLPHHPSWSSGFVSNVTLNGFFYSGLPNRNVLFYGDPERRPGESVGHKTAHRQGANPIEYTDKKEN